MLAFKVNLAYEQRDLKQLKRGTKTLVRIGQVTAKLCSNKKCAQDLVC